jgi:hypothetical protein
MKPQDIVFLLFLAFLLYKRNSRLLVASGILFLLLSMPLFAKWIFFTAERFTWYAAALFLTVICIQLISLKKLKR